MTTSVPEHIVNQRCRDYAHLPSHAARRHYDVWPASVDRDDLRQLAQIELWKSACRAPVDHPNFGGYANKAINFRLVDYRREVFGRHGQREAITCPNALPASIYETADMSGSSFEDVNAVQRLLRCCSWTDQQQRVIEFLLLDYSATEIAGELGVTRSRVSSIIRKIGERLTPHRYQLA